MGLSAMSGHRSKPASKQRFMSNVFVLIKPLSSRVISCSDGCLS